MTKFFLKIVFSIGLISCIASCSPKLIATLGDNKVDTLNRKQGRWVTSDDKTKQIIIANYLNDSLDGNYKIYRENRHLAAKGHYVQGKKNGRWKS